jgi:membrane dipeptidase
MSRVTERDDFIFVDACLTSGWHSDRVFLESMVSGRLAAANCNGITWEDFNETMTLIAGYKRWIETNSDVALQVYTTADIERARRERRTGIILGFQNISPIDERLYYLGLYRELGVRIIQLTYSTSSVAGAGCYESHDLPLTDFGHDLVAELNRQRILIDLSHCGSRTSADALSASSQPVVYTHTAPAGLKPVERNKTDEQLRAIADRGGVVGIAGVLGFLRAGRDATIDDYIETIEYVINVAGEEHVGIGLDIQMHVGEMPDYAQSMEYSSRDRGYGRYYIQTWDIVEGDYDHDAYIELMRQRSTPTGMEDMETRGDDLVSAMERRGWTEERILNVMGLNWLRLFKEVWGA